MGVIRIQNMQFHTYNGVFEEERKLGQRLQVDVELRLPIEKQVQHDELAETVDYGAVPIAGIFDAVEIEVSSDD